MLKQIGMTAVPLFALTFMGFTARAGDKPVPIAKVPAAVMKAVKDKFPKAEIKNAETEVEDGKTTFEIGLKEGGRSIDMTLKEDGTIVEIEKEITTADLPTAVANSIKAKYSTGKIKKAEEVTKGETKTFEVVVADGNRSREVVLDLKGKILEDENGDND